MKTFFHKLWQALGFALMTTITACEPGPELHLHDGIAVSIELPLNHCTIDELWRYDLSYKSGMPSTYNWEAEWYYGWDEADEHDYGPIGYKELRQYQIRRYYLGSDPNRQHDRVREDYCLGNTFNSTYNYGYYDILLWNDPDPVDGVESNHFDESNLDDVSCYTNASMTSSRYNLETSRYAYYPPDELFSAYQRALYISRDPADYDSFDATNDIYYKSIDFYLEPRVYIYLTQLIIHNNQGRATGTGGVGMISGLARTTDVNSGVAGSEPVSVTFTTRMKQNVVYKSSEVVDIIGGRLTTFGICGINPNQIDLPMDVPGYLAANTAGSYTHHYLDVNFIFYNGCDSTLTFDISRNVMERFRGGVITYEVDMDTIPIPQRGGGTGFNPGVGDYDDGGTHEIEM